MSNCTVFPIPDNSNGHGQSDEVSLRDLLACVAMHALVQQFARASNLHKEIGMHAYAVADSMMKARSL